MPLVSGFFLLWSLWAFLFGRPLFAFWTISGKQSARLPGAVSRYTNKDVAAVIQLLVLKYFLKPLGLLPGLGVADDGQHFVLPEITLDASLEISQDDERKYDHAADLSRGHQAHSAANDRVMLLPALTTPLMSTILANRHCPVMAFGSVNTKNQFFFTDPEACRDPLKHLELSTAVATARFGGPQLQGRRVKRGMEFDIEVVVTAARKGSSDSKEVFKQCFTVLTFLPKSTKPLFKESGNKGSTEKTVSWNWSSAFATSERLALDSSAPRRWAAICKDYNPIHVFSLAAKLFGFPGKIAHGNHVLTCALHRSAQLAGTDSRQWTKLLLQQNEPCTLEVQFRRPMVLPVRLEMEHASNERGEVALRLVKSGKDYVTAQAKRLERHSG